MSDGPSALGGCFEEGAEARRNGLTEADNPYAIGTRERREWTAGFNATLDLDEEDDPASDREAIDEP